jgi:carboxylesterase type B
MLSWSQEITINTQLGQITGMGRTHEVGNTTVYDFRKIPFAKAPIGDLRFEKPQPHGSWNDTLVARTYGPSCFQNLSSSVYEALQNKNVSEDCLYLNIHVPGKHCHNNGYRKEICHFVCTENKKEINITNW